MNEARRGALAIVVAVAAIVGGWLLFRGAPSGPTGTASSSSAVPLPPSFSPGTTPPGSGDARVVEAPPYAAPDDGFTIVFPSLAPPTIDRGEQETDRGKVPARTYYVTYGASAYSISAARYTASAIGSTPVDALTRQTRDDIVRRAGARVVGERPFEVKDDRGATHVGLYQELALPRGLRGLYAIVFVCEVAYTLSVAGPVGDRGLDARLFGAFVGSLRITQTFGCPVAP